jgi:tRNA (cytidine/uridine-2'-O-)-methyltransferase
MSAEDAARDNLAEGPTIALYQPDIAGNSGTILRTAACLSLPVALIEPAGFDASDRALRRAGMDYLEMAALTRYPGWDAFESWRQEAGRRLILFTTKASISYTRVDYRASDILLFGRESAGVPDHVHGAADLRVAIPMREGARSLNLAVAVGMAAGEAVRSLR